ncbi:serine/threonine protein kinase [Candidatus Micrarchaeota archaeon]|nr:serine/threonine protein kinase [Candidatus Micrarchaeota archaeon]
MVTHRILTPDPLGKTGARGKTSSFGGSLSQGLPGLPLEDIPDSLVGQVVGGYRITRLLGAGGMGRVYHGEAPTDPRYPEVALKFLSPLFAGTEVARRRFFTEFSAAMSVNHSNVAKAIRIDEYQGLLYFVMEYLNGNDLSRVLDVGRWDPLSDNGSLALMVRILTQVCDGIHAAHELGVIHRDLKPENIVLLKGTNGRIKIIDMGIARMELGDMENSGGITNAGTAVGTPYYMSPEAAQGNPCDARSDVYSLGAVAYLLFTGREAFDADTAAKIMIQQVTKQPTRPSLIVDTGRKEVVEVFEPVVLKAMEKDPDNRFQTMLELKDALIVCARKLGLNLGDDTIVAPTVQKLQAIPPRSEPEIRIEAEEEPRHKRIWPRAILAATLVVAGVIGGVTGWLYGARETEQILVETPTETQVTEEPRSGKPREKKQYNVFVSTKEPAFAEIQRTDANGLVWFENIGNTPLRTTFDSPELLVIRSTDTEKAPVLIEVDADHSVFKDVEFARPIPATAE